MQMLSILRKICKKKRKEITNKDSSSILGDDVLRIGIGVEGEKKTWELCVAENESNDGNGCCSSFFFVVSTISSLPFPVPHYRHRPSRQNTKNSAVKRADIFCL